MFFNRGCYYGICILPPSLLATEWKSTFSTTVKADMSADFSLVPVSLSFRHAQTLLPVRGFWEPLYFLNLLYFSFFLINFHKPLLKSAHSARTAIVKVEKRDQHNKTHGAAMETTTFQAFPCCCFNTSLNKSQAWLIKQQPFHKIWFYSST